MLQHPLLRSLICLSLLASAFLTTSFTRLKRTKVAIDNIVIDAGHGGKDPGCHGNYTKEKSITLAVVQKVGEAIRAGQPDFTVTLTRNTDNFVELGERAQIANRNKADVFISIHCNANPNHYIGGSETYALGLHKAGDNLVMMTENSSILLEENYQEKYDGFDPNSEEAYIIFSLTQNAYLKQSLDLAGRIESNFHQTTHRVSRGVKQAGFLVLWRTTMPAVLIEIGFLTNSVEERFLNSAEGQRYIANSIYKAIMDYNAARS